MMRSISLAPWPGRAAALFAGFFLGCSSPLLLADDLSDAQRLSRQGHPALALEKIDTFLAGKPDDAQARFARALLLIELGRSPEAIEVFSKLIEDYPELPEPYNNLAVLYAQQRQYDKARTALEMAIRVQPRYATAHENLGDVYVRLAGQAYDKAIQIDPARRQTQTKLARLREIGSAAAGGGLRTAGETGLAGGPQAAASTARGPEVDAAAAPASPADESAVLKALEGWANAWSRKDTRAYFAYYSADFRPPRGLSRKAWETERTRPMHKPGKISVEVEEVRVSFSGDKATVRFRQNFSSPALKSSVIKTLVFGKSRGRWLIEQERIG
ncbi:tetratricopeptide repeat protein [Accumulibacter sp.]|uniref:nuclear transport factor 2 family protein n=1 Tax=Accumulibacter sp. TaxID=2053492 RepID=UPI0025D178DB|nr:tetratricopeptide repeat protein [Accumulibacter sp.]MCM8594300.1 tetratricopeptide repeat protein [Accumulibacter sp.]MCM8627877.1 tetratricopeptide repeat protein [Accumulibacter sp.]MDS4048444.1 tetratricopeptide repeat protein [Accumulibacter sp.]